MRTAQPVGFLCCMGHVIESGLLYSGELKRKCVSECWNDISEYWGDVSRCGDVLERQFYLKQVAPGSEKIGSRMDAPRNEAICTLTKAI